MANVEWVKIQSWHAIANALPERHAYITLCGKHADAGQVTDRRPSRGKSCETCLRILTKDA